MGKENKEIKKQGRVKKTVLTVLSLLLLIILIAAAILGYRYRSHIKAAIIWLTTSDEDIQKNIDKAKDKQTEVLNNSGFNASKELDEALMTGKISPEEHTQILLGNVTLEEILLSKADESETVVPEQTQTGDEPQINDTQTDDKSETESPGTDVEDRPSQPDVGGDKKDDGKIDKPKEPEIPQSTKPEDTGKPAAPTNEQTSATGDVDKRIAELVTRMYVLKSEYTGAIDGVVASMKAEYVKLPPEQRTTSAKQSIAAGYMSKINSMEMQCDAQVNAIVAELRQILKDNGRDMALADAILATYATEKENTKAYYLSTYGD